MTPKDDDRAVPPSVPAAQRRVAYSCVVDNNSVMMAQSFIWLTCLTELHGAAARDIYVHVVDITDRGYLDWLEQSGVNVVRRDVFDPRNRYCNKLHQLDTFLATDHAAVVLMDCDTAWVGNAIPDPYGTVTAKIVDTANPNEAILASVFAAAGVGAPDWVNASFSSGPGAERTDRNNCNGGFYVIDRGFLAALAPAWRQWARWCVDHADLLGPYRIHADQMGFALAMRTLGKNVEPLDLRWNFPTHGDWDPKRTQKHLLSDIAPQVLHYHKTLNAHFEIPPIGLPQVDAAITRVNATLREAFATRLPNSLFWNLRYSADPTLGSGVGSRGDILAQKRALVALALRGYERKPVLDVGCGDLELARTLPLTDYIGLDVAKDAIELARKKRPEWRYLVGHPANVTVSAPPPAVICLDVLIHQTARADFDRLVDELVRLTGERLIVSGYDERPSLTSAIVNFHEPLGEALRRRGVFREIVAVGKYRDVTVFVADKFVRGPQTHGNDMAPEDFNHAARLTAHPNLLRHLADLSRYCFGFFTRHFPRSLEYPWIAAKLDGDLSGQTIVDIGAGLCPLPPFLAQRGAFVHCLDSHPLVRTAETRAQWNEWGFFDYAALHPRLRSHHIDALAFQPLAPVDVVYSVSVVEHMPRRVWETTLAAAARWLKPGGRLLLTLDLVPGTDSLWNYAEGRAVEPLDAHGDRAAILRQLDELGFEVVEEQALRTIPQSRTDVLLLECRKQGVPAFVASPAAVLAQLNAAATPTAV
ncbi:MAG TPA: class I SAM-dependent methyltransferase [Stellaceae bacterium]|nr:class I SAM-dependent methyltransferase [Stellaceae bacterium]